MAFAVVVFLVLGEGAAATLSGGILLGVAFLIGIGPVVRGARPLIDLVRELRPLILPLLVAGIAGTVTFDWWVPMLVVPVLLAAGWYLIAAKEVKPAWEESKRAARWVLGSWIRLTIVGGLALALFWFSLRELVPTLDVNDDRPDALSALIVIALIFWITAVWFRLGGYSTSWLRVPVTVIAIGVVARLLMRAGLVPGEGELAKEAGEGGFFGDLFSWIEDLDNLLRLLLAALLFAILGDVLASLVSRYESLPRQGALGFPIAATLRGVGFGFAAIATAVLGAVAMIGAIDYASGAKEGLTPEDEVIEGRDVEREPLPTDAHALAMDYLPVLAFADDERWAPVDVESYIHNSRCPAELVSLTETSERGDEAGDEDEQGEDCEGRVEHPGQPDSEPITGELPEDCPGLRVPCYQITIRCLDGGKGCAEGEFRSDRGEAIPDYRDGAVYIRTISRGTDGDASGLPGIGPYPALQTLVQYWYFYRYNEWTRPVLSGHIVQRHEADWEAITIGFSADAPLFVGYSAHCGGSWRDWRGVELAPTPEVESVEEADGAETATRPRPLIAVAEGSHANYVKTDDRRAPDWASCSGRVPKGATTVLSYANNLRDETGYAWDWEPDPANVHFVDDAEYPMSFPGTWGGSDFIELVNERRQRLGKEGHGPLTPTLQPLWYDPIKTIFCSKNWDEPAGYSSEDCRTSRPQRAK